MIAARVKRNWKVNMKAIALAAALLLIGTNAHAADYTIVSSAWTCHGPGALLDMRAHSNDSVATDSVQREAKTAGCVPAFDAHTVHVVEFQGKYAFLCERITGAVMPITDCTYALTSDLRDKKGASVPDHSSKPFF